MIFRRRRTRIEIEHTTVRVEAGGLNSVVARPVVVRPPALSLAESVLARALPSPAAERTELNAQLSATPTAANPVQENRS